MCIRDRSRTIGTRASAAGLTGLRVTRSPSREEACFAQDLLAGFTGDGIADQLGALRVRRTCEHGYRVVG